jgi:hypothetical protein
VKSFRLNTPRLLGLGAALVPWGVIGFAALGLSSCHQAHDRRSVAPAVEANGPAAGGVVAPPSAPPAGQPVPAVSPPPLPPTEEQIQTAHDVQDNASAHVLAKQFETDPAALARQSSLCGPADRSVDVLYLTRKGPPSDDLRQFRTACIAKDIAELEVRDRASRGGVQNTRSL